MPIYFEGALLGLATFLIIGLFHPIVIKTEYYTGTRFWWVFLVAGVGFVAAALFVAHIVASALLGIGFRVFGTSSSFLSRESG